MRVRRLVAALLISAVASALLGVAASHFASLTSGANDSSARLITMNLRTPTLNAVRPKPGVQTSVDDALRRVVGVLALVAAALALFAATIVERRHATASIWSMRRAAGRGPPPSLSLT